MDTNVADLQMAGMLRRIAEAEFSASFNDDRGSRCVTELVQEYIRAGRPQNRNQWIRSRLKDVFVFLRNPPEWREPMPMWPFVDGKAMVFIGQMDVGEEALASTALSPKTTLYVFGRRVPV